MIGNDILLNGETIISSVGAHLTQENDGNLVLYRGASPAQRNGIIWQSNYHGDEGQYFTKLQRDGNWITWNGREDNKGDYVWKTESLGSGIGDYYISVDSDLHGISLYEGAPTDLEPVQLWDSRESLQVFNIDDL